MDVYGFASEENFTFAERVDACNSLDQGGFAGAVVADQGHHLAGDNLEVNFVEGLDGAKIF
jgi:hypothetical protein